MIDGKAVANYGNLAFKLGLDVVLPVADLITDLVFTISLFQKLKEIKSRRIYYEHEIFLILSVTILIVPVALNLLNVILSSEKRKNPKSYLYALFNQLLIPYLGFKCILNPDADLKEKLWDLKIHEILGESYLQAILQIEYLIVFSHSNEFQLSFQITSITISWITVIYGLSRYTLRNILHRDPEIKEIMLYTFTELSTTLAILTAPFGYIMFAGVIFLKLHIWFDEGKIIIIIVCIGIWILPLTVSVCVLSPRVGFQFAMLIDLRIYYSIVCKYISSRRDLVIARRNILFVTCLFNSLFIITQIMSIQVSSHEMIIRFIFQLSFSSISLLQTILELFYICSTKKSFLNWVFLSSLKERTATLEDQVMNETDGIAIIEGNCIGGIATTEKNKNSKGITEDNKDGNETIEENIESNAITVENIDGNAITEDNLDGNATTEENMNSNLITEENMDIKIITEEIKDGNAFNEEIIDVNAITEDNIDSNATIEENIEGNAITEENMNGNAITLENKDGNAITEDNINDNVITKDNINSNVITEEKVSDNGITDENVDGSGTTKKNIVNIA